MLLDNRKGAPATQGPIGMQFGFGSEAEIHHLKSRSSSPFHPGRNKARTGTEGEEQLVAPKPKPSRVSALSQLTPIPKHTHSPVSCSFFLP